MMNVLLLQPYITPYRKGLFNAIQSNPDINLTVVYFSKYEKRRKWKVGENRVFDEIQLKSIIVPINYENNKVYTNIVQYIWIILKLRPDIIVCCANREGRIAARLKNLLAYKIISWTEVYSRTMHNSERTSLAFQSYCQKVDVFVVPGVLSKIYVEEKCNAGTKKIVIAPNSIDAEVFSITETKVSEKFNRSTLNFVFCGNLTIAKGYDLLLESISRLNRSEFMREYHFHILGDGPLREKHMKNTTYYGYCSMNKCAEVMSSSNIFVLPSLRDWNPLTVLEAARTGNVLLLSDSVGNYPEFIPECGFLFRTGSSQALFDILLKTLSTPKNVLIKKAQNSRECGAGITHDKSAESFINAFQYVCRK